jgi:hypothetical protein
MSSDPSPQKALRTVARYLQEWCNRRSHLHVLIIALVHLQFVGDEPPADPRDYDFWGLAPRATAEIVFPDDVPSGGTVWVSAAWVSKRGKQGMASLPVRVTIQGGPVLPANTSLAIAA